MLAHDVLRRDDQEGVLDAPVVVVSGVALGPLEGVGPQVHELREAQRHRRVLPHVETYGALLQEQELPLLIAQGGELAVIGPVEKFLALAWTGAGQQIALVVAVEVNLEGFACRSARSFFVTSGSPAAAMNVGTQSSWDTMSLISVPGLTTPGQRIMPGTR
jgi:hypothetical protein